MTRFRNRTPPSSDNGYASGSDDDGLGLSDLMSSPLIAPGSAEEPSGGCGGGEMRVHDDEDQQKQQQVSVVAILVAALRKSFVMCSVGAAAATEDAGCSSAEISWPTEVRHIAHVTFDRFSGFLGLPVEFQPDLPARVPSASASVFGVSAKSMQCSYDNRGNSVPTILLSMQRHLYSQGGLQTEGIFRITAENSQEMLVREQLNTGVVPEGIDSHCLACLIKAWLRELPTGVLDSLTPDQVMHCNSEEECSQLVRMLPSTEAALLDWAINLMADVVQYEQYNRMNARNIAMVFAPNMTQMADPLTALIHAVQVMNFLKTLIMKTLREREEAPAGPMLFHSESPNDNEDPTSSKPVGIFGSTERNEVIDLCTFGRASYSNFLFSSRHSLDSDVTENFDSFEKNEVEDSEFVSGRSSTSKCGSDIQRDGLKNGYGNGDVEGLLDRLNFMEGIRKLCRHPVFQLSKSIRKSGGVVSSTGEAREACT
ncbi:rho GTPase-activating protein 3-like [Iris pallida]|uniref:Rho GTPase-activating protein 3-like n=1 Tax=Iris pallida TaxID=29817 RepID=A0AAX6FUX5_IRIPA|nr:rho GTPase-activating protein 3-like [Iris pallida]